MTLTGKSMFMAKKGASAKLEPCRSYENDYEQVEQDEQTDDYAGVPYVVDDDGFK